MKPRLTALASAAVLVGGALAPAASASPLSKTRLWQTRNGSVTCGIEIHARSQPATKVLCAARGIPAPKHGGTGDSGFVSIGLLGRPQVLRLSQNSFVSAKAQKLGRGRLWNQLGVTCHVGASTVLCFNGANHGFVIGNGHYRSF
jgi:hypothetical protein